MQVYSVAFSQDGKRLATGGGNGTVKLWNLKKDGTVDYNLNSTICPIANPTNPSGTNLENPSGANPANISGVVFSHDNKLLATLIEGRDAQNNPTTTINLLDIKQGKCIPRNIANTPLGQEGQPPNNQQTATRQKKPTHSTYSKQPTHSPY
ncbi:WD40 repeat domain-containing protein [Coleofasciculus sp. G1-WW12-02]|uniref:WD40 repeat domain-containing protein n=1 Tax=Coleofasciculus sp. G1-WW12-02 TaxID=3068483 RepID=UPI004063B005